MPTWLKRNSDAQNKSARLAGDLDAWTEYPTWRTVLPRGESAVRDSGGRDCHSPVALTRSRDRRSTVEDPRGAQSISRRGNACWPFHRHRPEDPAQGDDENRP